MGFPRDTESEGSWSSQVETRLADKVEKLAKAHGVVSTGDRGMGPLGREPNGREG